MNITDLVNSAKEKMNKDKRLFTITLLLGILAVPLIIGTVVYPIFPLGYINSGYVDAAFYCITILAGLYSAIKQNFI